MKLGLALLAALLGKYADEVGAKEIRSLAEADNVEGQDEVPTADRPWWDLGLADEVLNEVGLFYLGQAWHQATDIGEMLETFGRCNASDPWSWTLEFRKTSDRLEKLAKESADAGHHRSAGHYYLRAATYRRAALHRHPDPFHEDVPIQAQLAVDAFKKFLTEFEYPCEPVEIPYEATTLPGYLCINPNIDAPAPTIIFQEGKDGWAEDALSLRLGEFVDFLAKMNEVDEDNIALVAVSLGGYLGPRAAAFEPRLKALIANPGVIDWSRVYSDFLNEIDPNLMRLLEADPAAFDETIFQIMEHSPLMEWGMIDSMWHHNQTTPSELMEEISRFNNRETAKDITACTLVIDADAETRGQSLELFDSLVNCPRKDYVKFTNEEAAQLHVQPGATAILSARMFNWLDEVFAMNLSGAGATEAGIKSSATRSTNLSASVLVIGSAVVALAIAN